MPRDQRLYMTFPNDMWMHPKVAPLSDSAFRAFVEMNGYSRMQDLDGRVPAVMANRMWSSEAIAELAASHPERPLVVVDDGDVVIRDYAEHQQTTAEREALTQKRARSGRAGAAKRWQEDGKSMASAMANASQDDGKAMAETESETETPLRGVARKRATRIPDEFIVTAEMRAWASVNVPAADVNTSTAKFVDYWRAESGTKASKLDWVAAWRFWLRNDHQRVQPKTATPPRAEVPLSEQWRMR